MIARTRPFPLRSVVNYLGDVSVHVYIISASMWSVRAHASGVDVLF